MEATIKNENVTVTKINGKQICTLCIYDESIPSISFDAKGVCNYCHMVDRLIEEYHTGKPEGEKTINELIQRIKKDGKGKQYDCVVGVSGGTDSSYMVYWALQNGLRPLAVHYDNTWNTAIATENIRKVLTKLKVDLFTHVINNKEADDIFRAFFIAGVPEIDASTDLALAETMYRAAAKYKVKYVLEGHSFIAEGISPLGKNYFDGKYISSIHKMFGKLPMKTYPLMTFWKFIKWTSIYRIKKIRPLWYIKYSKEDARAFLEKEFGWEYYGGHHLENRMTSFFHSIYCPMKFHIDWRNNSLAASVRSGKMKREDAIEEYYNQHPYIEQELLGYFKKRLGFSDEEYDKIMKSPPRYWYEFPTYKKRFERLRPFFYMLMKAHLVPGSFYMKYCFLCLSNMITIVNYGMGNLGSVQNMFKRIGVTSEITGDPGTVANATKLLLPGVGAFDAAMEKIAESGLRNILDKKVREDKIPTLGICLGMQLLTNSSEEGILPGLGWLPAKSLKFKFYPESKLKIPHMGWNRVFFKRASPLIKDLPEESRFYFVHSYYVQCDNEGDVLTTTKYGSCFHSIVQHDNVYGAQFHPEKSHKFGMKLLDNFARI